MCVVGLVSICNADLTYEVDEGPDEVVITVDAQNDEVACRINPDLRRNAPSEGF